MKCSHCGHEIIRIYEFRFEHDRGMKPNEIKMFRGPTAREALRGVQQAIGNFWTITGYRRKGSVRFKPCSIKGWKARWSNV